MINTLQAPNIPTAYVGLIEKMHYWSNGEDSRNGRVMTSKDPVVLEITRPWERVLFDPVRDANPFFHVMEFVWMMAGRNDVKWISQFNRRFSEYADPGADTLHAAYGHRWKYHFEIDQVWTVIKMLQRDRTTRRAVIGMWDPSVDLEHHNDLPCNTSIMFRYVNDKLDMTVINRSNDLIWGMLGANAVHMTLLHEFIAAACDMDQGIYRVFTNNLHIYTEMPKFREIWETNVVFPGVYQDYPLVGSVLDISESYMQLFNDCEALCSCTLTKRYYTRWVSNTARPMYLAYMERLDKAGDGMQYAENIESPDWRRACIDWIKRRETK
jgi:hypothetical protein